MSGGKRRSETSSNQFLSGFTNGGNLFCKLPSVFSLPPPLFFFLFFFYILKRVREREREREDSTIRVTNERTNDAINLLTILKCLISVFRFTWRFCIVATTNCSGKKNIRKTHTHLTPKNKKKKQKKKRYEKNENNDVIIISTSIFPLFHPRNIYTSGIGKRRNDGEDSCKK